jgi:multidrug efflux system membrane fusion protein
LKRRETGTATPGERPSIFSKEEVEVWRTRVNVAKANEAERKAELDRAALEYENCYIKAPVPGVIERKMVQLGEWLQPGRQIALIVKTDELLLRFFVPEDEAISLKTGMAAHFTVLNASRTYEAKLIHVAAYADQTSRMVEVIAEVSKVEDGNLTPGAFARVTVPFGSNDNAATVNETAIRPSERGFLVFVIGEDNKAHEREIETGLRTADGRIEVTKGLKVGEKVVTAGAEALRDGADVSISSESEGSDK